MAPETQQFSSTTTVPNLNKIDENKMYVCILNWPLTTGAFQDQCKRQLINIQIKIRIPNWWEADQLAIYKPSREVELGASENNIS